MKKAACRAEMKNEGAGCLDTNLLASRIDAKRPPSNPFLYTEYSASALSLDNSASFMVAH